eukprot:1152548-Pelagomonas_calceolata.AAC.4
MASWCLLPHFRTDPLSRTSFRASVPRWFPAGRLCFVGETGGFPPPLGGPCLYVEGHGAQACSLRGGAWAY